MEIQSVDRPTQASQQALAEGLEWHTAWSMPLDGSAPDAERHQLFAAYVLEVAMQERPLLIPFLVSVGGCPLVRAQAGGKRCTQRSAGLKSSSC